jgi:hypothetical protein
VKEIGGGRLLFSMKIVNAEFFAVKKDHWHKEK